MRASRIAAAGLAMAVTGGASVAWACSPSAYFAANPTKGPAGAEVRVTGNAFYPTGGTTGAVEIRWGSAGGTQLGAAPGPSFSVQVNIPANAAPGVYTIVAVQRDIATGQVKGQKPAAFSVTSSQTTSGASGSSGSSGSGSSNTSGGVSGGEQSAPETSSEPSTSNTATSNESTTNSGATTPAPERSASASAPTSEAQASSGAATSGSGSSAARATAVPTETRVGAGTTSPQPASTPLSVGDASPTAPTADQQALVVSDEQAGPAVSPRSATADLWQGFAEGGAPSAGAGLDSPAPPSSGSSSLPLGVGLLGLGLVGLSAGAATAARRRRVEAGAQR